jgi:hypothetical protein
LRCASFIANSKPTSGSSSRDKPAGLRLRGCVGVSELNAPARCTGRPRGSGGRTCGRSCVADGAVRRPRRPVQQARVAVLDAHDLPAVHHDVPGARQPEARVRGVRHHPLTRWTAWRRPPRAPAGARSSARSRGPCWTSRAGTRNPARSQMQGSGKFVVVGEDCEAVCVACLPLGREAR